MDSFLSTETCLCKRAKLNNVISSLDRVISETTNDKTIQDYGTINYCGTLKIGQTIKGSRIPSVSCIPIFSTSNVFVGYLQPNGDLLVENDNEIVGKTSCTSVTKTGTYEALNNCLVSNTDCCCEYSNITQSCTYAECGYTVTCVCSTILYRRIIEKPIMPNNLDYVIGRDSEGDVRYLPTYQVYPRYVTLSNPGLCRSVCDTYYYIDGNHVCAYARFCVPSEFTHMTVRKDAGTFDIQNECVNLYNDSFVKWINRDCLGSHDRAWGVHNNYRDYASIRFTIDVTTTTVSCTCYKKLDHDICIDERYL